MLHDKNWLSYDFYNWIETKDLPVCDRLHSRCSYNLLAEAIRKYPSMVLAGIRYYPRGAYEEEGKPPLNNLPAFYEVDIVEQIGKDRYGEIRVYLPLCWNGDFMGIAGAGTNLEFDWCLLQTTNLTTWPIAVKNGYACAVTNGGTGTFDFEWGFLKDGSPDWTLIRHWAFDGTHTMTLAGKAIVEAAYGVSIRHSYMHGTSGGGRQVIVEAQKYPEDYDGLWADGPGYDCYNLMFSILWAPVVFHNEKHKVPVSKFRAVYDHIRTCSRCISMGPFDLKSASWVQFVRSLAGLETPDGPITPDDLAVMLKVWCGPCLSDGTRITYGFGPEIAQWAIGPRDFGCLLEDEKGDLVIMPVALQCMRWIAHDPDLDISRLSYTDFEKLYYDHRKEFADYSFYESDINEFTRRGGKLMITHGTGDPIVPSQLTVDYYRKVLRDYSSETEMNRNFRIFLLKDAGHALYDWTGPNVTNASGMEALIRWVEEDDPPEWVDTLFYDFEEDRMIEEDKTQAFSLWQWRKHYGK